MKINRSKIVQDLSRAYNSNDLNEIKDSILRIQTDIDSYRVIEGVDNDKETKTIVIQRGFLIDALSQIQETHTIERTKYYLTRLIKSFTKVKTSKINDINLYRWKEYQDIITDSLWIINRRDSSGAHNAGYWGNFIPQIPNQFIRRYTKRDEWVLDTFLGSGTTLIECKRLGRNGIGIELQSEVAQLAKNNVQNETNLFTKNVQAEIVIADSIELDYPQTLNTFGIESVQFVIMHPPYWDIIKFSEDPRDLSNSTDIEAFLEKMSLLAVKVNNILDKDRYCALVIGDKYSKGEWIPLGFYTMQEFLKNGFTLKSTIIKNFEETKGKKNAQELWRYRALVGGFYIFKHEYIFLFKKEHNLGK